MKKLAIALCLVPYALCAAPDLAQVQSQIKAAEIENRAVSAQVQKSSADLKKTQKQLVRAAEKTDEIEAERSDLVAKIAKLDARAEKLRAGLATKRGRLAEAAGILIAAAQEPTFDIKNTRDYVLASAILTNISELFNDEMSAARAALEDLESVRAERARQKEKLDKTAKKYAAERADMDKLLRARAAQNEKLKMRQYELQKQLKRLSERAKNLAELAAGVGAAPAGGEYSGRKMRSPVAGRLLLTFGEKSELGLVSDGWHIRTRAGAIATSPADGKIEFADSFRGHKMVLIIRHAGGYYSVLAGLGSLDVIVGQEVLAGEPIGRMPPERPEMYLELRRGANAIDPARMFVEP